MILKKLLPLLLISTILLSLSSCSDDEPGGKTPNHYVFTPYSIMLDIRDEQGRSRLSPQHPQTLLGKEMTATMRGKTYTFRIVDPFVDYDPTYLPGGEPFSRYTDEDVMNGNVPAQFFGLYLAKSDANPIYKAEVEKFTSQPYLALGQFHGEGKYEETITFHIPGYPEEIKVEFARELLWDKEHDTPYYKGYTRVNGQEKKEGVITIMLPTWQ